MLAFILVAASLVVVLLRLRASRRKQTRAISNVAGPEKEHWLKGKVNLSFEFR